MNEPIRLFLVSPALAIRRALARSLDAEAEILVVGEAASAAVPAALGNAVFDATGVRLRVVPFRPDRVKAALAATRT